MRNYIKKTEYSIKLCLVKIEEIQRSLSKPKRTYDINRRSIEALQLGKTSLEQELLKVTNEINENEKAYRSFLSSRIVLD